MQSGSALNTWATPNNTLQTDYARRAGIAFGCNDTNTDNVVKCMRRVEAKRLANVVDRFKVNLKKCQNLS